MNTETVQAPLGVSSNESAASLCKIYVSTQSINMILFWLLNWIGIKIPSSVKEMEASLACTKFHPFQQRGVILKSSPSSLPAVIQAPRRTCLLNASSHFEQICSALLTLIKFTHIFLSPNKLAISFCNHTKDSTLYRETNMWNSKENI